MTNTEIRIQAGIFLLDHYAPDWCDKVDYHKLDMGQEDQCILGQVFAYVLASTPFHAAVSSA